MKKWDESELNKLPVEDGIRLRGRDMTRLETLTDASFAFAITMLVISIGTIPSNLKELVDALKVIPAFLFAFAIICLFWSAHRDWSRYYGIENIYSRLITFGLIFTVLVYMYPLRLMASSFMNFLSGGFLPTEFLIADVREVPKLFVIYGIGFTIISSIFVLLYYHAWKKSDSLNLNNKEKVFTIENITAWSVCGITGLLASSIAAMTDPGIGIFSSFLYCTLPVTVPLIATLRSKAYTKSLS